MDLWHALFLGALQGVSELFPVSSLAQTILIPAMLHWDNGPDFLAFVVALHLATAVALVLYFWKDWIKVIRAFAGCLTRRKLVYDRESKFAWLLVAGTLFVGVAGLVLEKRLRTFFDRPEYAWVVAVFLIVNGGIMLYGDFMKRRAAQHSPDQPEHDKPSLDMHIASAFSTAPAGVRYSKHAEDLSFTQGTLVGATQALALLPGISRSGVTIVAGLFAGLTYEQASRFAFMLATPVIGLAAILKVPALLKPQAHDLLKVAVPSALVAGVAAYLSTAFLMRYFKNHRLWPFAVYCVGFGAFALVKLKYHA